MNCRGLEVRDRARTYQWRVKCCYPLQDLERYNQDQVVSILVTEGRDKGLLIMIMARVWTANWSYLEDLQSQSLLFSNLTVRCDGQRQ